MSVVADVRHAPALLKRRGRPALTRAHRVVRSSHFLVLGPPPGDGQHEDIRVHDPQPVRRQRFRISTEREDGRHHASEDETPDTATWGKLHTSSWDRSFGEVPAIFGDTSDRGSLALFNTNFGCFRDDMQEWCT